MLVQFIVILGVPNNGESIHSLSVDSVTTNYLFLCSHEGLLTFDHQHFHSNFSHCLPFVKFPL